MTHPRPEGLALWRALSDEEKEQRIARASLRWLVACWLCGTKLRNPSPDGLCGFCREEAEL